MQRGSAAFGPARCRDAGKGILAREGLKKALLDAEDQVISHDIIPDEPISSSHPAED